MVKPRGERPTPEDLANVADLLDKAAEAAKVAQQAIEDAKAILAELVPPEKASSVHALLGEIEVLLNKAIARIAIRSTA